MTLEESVARHYTDGSLLARIDAGLRKLGLDPENPSIDDLKAADEFHTGGFEATLHLLDPLEISADHHVVDFGCGIGGAARHIHHRYGARVTGVDLTEDFVQAGQTLNARLGLCEEAVTLLAGSVLDMPLPDACADLAVMIHVGMNIADKKTLLAEVARVLKPGGRFALFDVMRGAAEGDIICPLPWADRPEVNHVHPPGTYRRAARASGLVEVSETDRTTFALDFFHRMRMKIAAEGPPALGVNLMMGDSAPLKLRTYAENLSAGRVAPIEMVFAKP